MIARLKDWFDHRTGYRKLRDAMLLEHIPGGAKWRYVWGSCLAFVFTVQLITGVLLMTAYSPGDSTAWSSVYFIQYEMDFGWLIRGLHHFGSQTMVVLLGVHMLQVVIAGAHLPPRELNWWLGLALMVCVLGLSLTGYLLPWDQKGYEATRVATNIAGNIPLIGSWLSKIIVGGPEYGNHTLTRFYALHVGILPPLVIVLVIAHLALFRRHGITPPADAQGEDTFWPRQAFRDMVVCMIVFGFMLGLVVWGHGHKLEGVESAGLYDALAHAGRDGRGANLDAPADLATQSYPARPEWYFLFLFQLLKYFEGPYEIVGTVVIPASVGLVLFVLPLLGFGRMRRLGHIIGVLVVTALLTGVVTLTYLALAADLDDPVRRWLLVKTGTLLIPLIALILLLLLALLAVLRRGGFRRFLGVVGTFKLLMLSVACAGLSCLALGVDWVPQTIKQPIEDWSSRWMRDEEKKRDETAKRFNEDRQQADALAKRAVQLAHRGSPDRGARYLLRNDPMTRGKALFQQNCAGCHSYKGVFDTGDFRAADLAGFGSQEWVLGLLNNPGHKDYFGRTGRKSMDDFMNSAFPDRLQKGDDRNDVHTLARWLAAHPRKNSAEREEAWFKAGVELFEKRECMTCHAWEGKGQKKAPDLTGYGDVEWLRLMLMAPNHPSRYGTSNTMPAFRALEGPGGEVTRREWERTRQLLLEQASGDDEKSKNKREEIEKSTQLQNLSDLERELIIHWILKDDRVLFGGQPITPVPR